MWTIPPLFIVTLGREYFFHFVERRFDRDPTRSEKDGAFIAELLETVVSLKRNDYWFVHRESPDMRFQVGDPHRNWKRMRVVEVRESDLKVVPAPPRSASNSLDKIWAPVKASAEEQWITYEHSAAPSHELLETANSNLR